jgi:outer membrane protein assembly factor BamB
LWKSTPTIHEGTVYFAALDGKLHAVDQQSGREKWLLELGDYVTYSSPAIADGLARHPKDTRRLKR